MLIICPVCGKETEGGYKFCMNCRSEIGGANASQAAQTVQAAATQATSADPGSIAQAAAAGVSAAAATAAPKITAVPGAQVGTVPGAQVGAAPGASQAMPPQNYDSYEPYVKQGPIPDYSNYPNMYAAPDPNAPQPVKKKKGPGAGRKVAAFFLGIFLFFSGLVTLSLYCVKETVSVENLTAALTDASAITSIEVSDLTGRDEDKGKTISGYILEQIPEEQKEKFPELTEDSINQFLSDEAAQEVLAVPLGDLIDYLAGEKEEFSIDSEQVIQALEENSDAIEKYTGKKLDTEDLTSIRDAIEEFNETELKETPGIKNDGIGVGMKVLKFFMSDTMFYVAAGITAFFALMIILVFGRYIDSALIRIGLTGVCVGGVVYFGIKFGRYAIDRTVAGKLGQGALDMLDKVVFDQFKSTGFMVLCTAVGTIVVGVVVKVLRNSLTK